MSTKPIRVRREPEGFRSLRVSRIEQLGPFMTRVTLGGHELEGFDRGLPAASVRLLLPEPESGLVVP
ncbi:MAG: siderophore-interacting protein, partial [Acidimicrobiales bacterium]